MLRGVRVWESLELAVNKAETLLEIIQSEREDLGPGCNKVYVAPCLVKLGVTPQHLAVSARCK